MNQIRCTSPGGYAPTVDRTGVTDIPSYNQALTALRCFGILETFLQIVAKRSDELVTAGTISQGQADNVTTNLESIKANALALTFNPALNGTMTYDDYNTLKWYWDVNDETYYGEIP